MGRVALMLAVLLAACGQNSAPSPFVDPPDGNASDAMSDVEDAADGPVLGKPCVDDGQCDDGIDCTFDNCDAELKRCRSAPDHSLCADSIFCDGQEICDVRLGCVEGEPVSCSDNLPCTIDRCVEATKSCEHLPRDADGDGDPTWNCGGGDCNDNDPLVSSLVQEICGNQVDDDCDSTKDEADCKSPLYDGCLSPLSIEASGAHALSFLAASRDVASSCVPGEGPWRDVVATLVVRDGPALDVDVVATTTSGEIALASATVCGDATTELGCALGSALPNDAGQVARLRLRAPAPGNYPLYVYGRNAAEVTLKVAFLPAAAPPTNQTCSSAEPIKPGEPTLAALVDASRDLETACDATSRELVYSFDLSEPRDVDVFATSRDGLGDPILSLRTSDCQPIEAEITCRKHQPAHLFARALPVGTYFLAVAASGPSDVDVLLDLKPASPAPADETCAGAPSLAPNRSLDFSVAEHTDDVLHSCLVGAPDAAYSLELTETSDVLLVSRISQGDTVAVSLMRPECRALDTLVCEKSQVSPVRARVRAMPAGTYRTVVDSAIGSPVTLTAFVRATRPATLVAFADDCEHALVIPRRGGFFQGSTTNAAADYSAGCDLGGLAASGAPDQMLKLTLDETQRVILDMRGSAYDTLLNVRTGPACPGTEVARGCTLGSGSDSSFLDLTLSAGQYFIQIDGYAGASGSWTLDVFIVDP